jgi:hypothetical protein
LLVLLVLLVLVMLLSVPPRALTLMVLLGAAVTWAYAQKEKAPIYW